MEPNSWIGVDWGTSNLRVFLVGSDGSVIDERSSERGMSSLKPHEFETALLELIDGWLEPQKVTLVLACGMVGAKQGWMEALYRSVPCAPIAANRTTPVPTKDPRIDVRILPGLSQHEPADVMRGEETQIAGFMGIEPDFEGAVCLPGTHSKWANVDGGRVETFSTFMTGEMFELLSKTSVLKHSMTDTGWDQGAFVQAARDAISDPANVTANLFSVRAGGLVLDGSAPQAKAQLSGMLIGQEIGLAKKWWSGRKVAIIGSASTAPLYVDALSAVGVDVTRVDTQSVTLHGLSMVANELAEAI